MAAAWGIVQDKKNAIFSTVHNEKENLNSGKRRENSIKQLPKILQIETRKALGNVSNIVSHKSTETSATVKGSSSLLLKSKSNLQKSVRKDLAPKLEKSISIACPEELSDREDMHNYTEPEDDYEDIFPKHERLSKEECDWLKDWKPTCSNSNSYSFSPYPSPEAVLEKWTLFENLIPSPLDDSEMYDDQELIFIPHLVDSV